MLPPERRLTKLWIKHNFLSDYHKIALNQRFVQAGLTAFDVYIDDFEGVNLLSKDFIDKSIWITPMDDRWLEHNFRSLMASVFQFEETVEEKKD